MSIEITNEELEVILTALQVAAIHLENRAINRIDPTKDQQAANEYRLLSDRLWTRKERAGR